MIAVRISRLWVVLALQVVLAIGLGSVAAADPEPSGDLNEWSASTVVTGEEAVGLVNDSDDDGHDYSLINMCGNNADCVGLACDAPPHGGIWFELLQDGESHQAVCLNPDQAAQLGQITPGLVLREFKSLEWPGAELVVQPKGNETLVNFKTLFYTTLAEPSTQTITLLGHKVVIEATPTTYIWHSDQGDAETWETNDPSRPIENGNDPADLNHYVYESKGKARPSVDVVYSGRYRVDGGAWQEIPDTLTLAGAPVDLSILEATPVLTGRQG